MQRSGGIRSKHLLLLSPADPSWASLCDSFNVLFVIYLFVFIGLPFLFFIFPFFNHTPRSATPAVWHIATK